MNPLHDYIVIEPIVEDKKTSFKVEEDEPSLLEGKVVAYGIEDSKLIGAKVLFKKHLFELYKGKYIGKYENVIATL